MPFYVSLGQVKLCRVKPSKCSRGSGTSLKWHPFSRLALVKTEIEALRDLGEVWTEKLELDGVRLPIMG